MSTEVVGGAQGPEFQFQQQEWVAKAFVAADRFRGEETANLARAGIALALVVTGQPYGALALATLVLVVAVVLRSGYARLWVSLVTVAIDTETLVFLVDDPSLPVMVAGACAAVALSAVRFDWRVTLGAGALAWCGLRAQILQYAILRHSSYRAREISAEEYRWFMAPVAVAVLLAIILAVLRDRRIAAHARRASGALPLVERAGYRAFAVGASSGVNVCARCHAPLSSGPAKCWLCTAPVDAEHTLDSSRVVQRVFDPRAGRHVSLTAAMLASTTVLAVFAQLVTEGGATPWVLVAPALFVVVVLVPLIAYVRSPGSRRGEMLVVSGVSQPIGVMLSIALGLSTLVLVFAAFGVVVAAICTAQGFPMR